MIATVPVDLNREVVGVAVGMWIHTADDDLILSDPDLFVSHDCSSSGAMSACNLNNEAIARRACICCRSSMLSYMASKSCIIRCKVCCCSVIGALLLFSYPDRHSVTVSALLKGLISGRLDVS
jgi:hypothetical protein